MTATRPEQAHRQDPHYKDAVEAVIEAAEGIGYRQMIAPFAWDLLDAALPHLRLMIECEGRDGDT